MAQGIIISVEGDLIGQRLDAALAAARPEQPRKYWNEQAATGLVSVNSKAVQPSYRLKEGDKVSIRLAAAHTAVADSYDGPSIPVLYRDEDMIVINKPAGIVVHAGEGVASRQTVAACFASEIEQDGTDRAGIVHRLDKDTSGVMVLARTLRAAEELKAQFAARSVKKQYQALVWGHMDRPRARIELPLARHHNIPTKMSVAPDGKLAITEYEVVKEYADYSLLDLRILTGRMHQIRVHLAYLGNPVVGDMVYTSKSVPAGIHRQFLHAKSIALKLMNGEVKEFEAPLPEELAGFLEGLTSV